MAGKLFSIITALALALGTAPAFADVPVSGSFVANAACPAVSSIKKGTNPGDVALAPTQSYEVVSGNKSPPTHYLVIVPGASPDRRWVEIGCGTLNGAAPSATPAAAPATTTVAAPASAPASGDPHNNPVPTANDQYVLAISWEPAFCAGHGDKAECAAETPQSFEASHFTLHGLWRDPWPQPYSNCQADGQKYMEDANNAGSWGDVPALQLSPATASHLAQDMPGTLSHLERHEWIVHGLCAGVSADAFFARATALLDDVNATAIRTFFAGKAGQRLGIADIRAAFDQAYGAGAGRNVIMDCGGGNITEIHLGLTGDVIGSGKLADLLAHGYVPGDNRPCNAGRVVTP